MPKTLIELAIEFKERNNAMIKLSHKLIKEVDLSDEEILEFTILYPEFQVGESLVVGDYRRYNNFLYKVVYEHITQVESDWLPDYEGSSLFTKVMPAGVIGEWIVPEGLHDAYQIGDLVTYEGQTWINTFENNAYFPGEFGWDLYES